MNVTHKITMDLTRPTNGNRINVVEGDRNSRIVNVHLYENSVNWEIPDEAIVLIKWERESGVGGEYNQLSDGSSAWYASGNVLTITLSEESTKYSGTVKFSIIMETIDSQISTFTIVANVHAIANGKEETNSGSTSPDVSGLQRQIGNLAHLETKNKSNLVSAINEAAKSGDGGVYVGSGEMPDGYNIQIDPTGSADVAATMEWVNNHVREAIQNEADPIGTAERNVTEHNTSTDSHNDIRLIIDGLSNRLNALVNSTDNNLEKIAELVEYINANKDLIDSITTSKVSVTDIINNLTTNVADKPLSAAQGVALKALIDAITIPTKLSQLTNDTGYLTQHQSLSGYAKTSEIKKWTLAQIQAAIDATWGAIY